MATEKGAPHRKDGRKPLLIYMKPDLIQDLKQSALEEETHVYLIVEDLVKARKGSNSRS